MEPILLLAATVLILPEFLPEMFSRKEKKKANYSNDMFWKQSQYDQDNYHNELNLLGFCLINFSTNSFQPDMTSIAQTDFPN